MAKSRGVFTEEGHSIPVEEVQEAVEQRARQLADSPAFMQSLDEEEDADELRALAEIDGAGDVIFQVHRLLPPNARGFVGQLSASELTLERIQQEWGKGKYKVRGLRTNGTYAGQRTIEIATEPKPLASAAPHSTNAPTSLADVLVLMEQQNERRRQDDKERSESMLKWAAILGPIFAPVIGNLFGSKGPTLAELTTTLTNMKELNGGNESQVSKLTELKDMLEIVRGIAPEKDTGSTWIDLVRDGFKEIGPAVTSLVGSRLPGLSAPAPQVPQQIAAPVQGQIHQPEKGVDPMLALLGWLKEQLAGLAHQASLNKDPALYAEVVLDNLPPGVDPKMLLNFLGANDWWSKLTQFFPGVQPYPQWFADCRKELVSGLQEMIAAVEMPTPPEEQTNVAR